MGNRIFLENLYEKYKQMIAHLCKDHTPGYLNGLYNIYPVLQIDSNLYTWKEVPAFVILDGRLTRRNLIINLSDEDIIYLKLTELYVSTIEHINLSHHVIRTIEEGIYKR